VANTVNSFVTIYPKWSNCVKESGIRIGWGIAAGFFVGKMKLPIKEEGNHKVIELSIFK
jgi:hypothetical protein